MAFSDDMKTMCESLEKSRSEREKAMAQFHSASRKDKVERRAFLKRTFGDVHVLIQHFHTDRGKMGKEMREMLEKFCAETRKEVRGFLKDFRSQHKAMSGRQKEELEAFCNGLRRDVGQMRKGFQQFQKTLRADFKKAHGYFLEFANQMQQTRRATKKPGGSSLQSQIMETLKTSPEGMTLKELSYSLGRPGKSLSRTLTRMRQQKHLTMRNNLFFAPA